MEKHAAAVSELQARAAAQVEAAGEAGSQAVSELSAAFAGTQEVVLALMADADEALEQLQLELAAAKVCDAATRPRSVRQHILLLTIFESCW